MIEYGQTSLEILMQELDTCNSIVNEIMNFGVSERQKLHIIKKLAQNIEDFEASRNLVNVVNDMINSMFPNDQLNELKNERLKTLVGDTNVGDENDDI